MNTSPVEACQEAIFDEKLSIKKKIKYIDKELSRTDSSDVVTLESFGRLYTLLASSISSPDHKQQCLQKAQQVYTNLKNTQEVEDQLSCIRLQLENIHLDKPSGKTSPTSLQRIPSIFSKKKEKRLSATSEEQAPNELLIASEFNKKFSNLYELIAEYRIQLKIENSGDELAAIQQGMRGISETYAEYKETISKIKSGEIDKASAESLLETAKHLSEDLTWIAQKIDILDISQDRDIYQQQCQDLLKKLSAYITKAPEALKEAKEVVNAKPYPLIQLCKDCQNSQSKLFGLMKQKISISNTTSSYLNDLFYAWVSFFQFTEKNFFILNEEARAKLYESLMYAEEFFKKRIDNSSEDTLIHEGYIKILVQKHPFINDAKQKQENFQLFRNYLNIYRLKYNQKPENTVNLEKIFNTSFSISQTPAAQIIRCKLTYTNEKDKVKDIIGSILSNKGDILVALAQYSITYQEKNQQISLLLKNIQVLYQKLDPVDLSNHALEVKDKLKIAYIVEKTFFYHSFEECQKGQVVTSDNLFLTKKDSYFNRSILIDTERRSFTILSKLHGDLKKAVIIKGKKEYDYVQGGIKRVTASASFFTENDKLVHKETILATPKEGKVFDKKFIDYLFEFHNSRGLIGCYYYMQYECPKSNKLKQLVIQDRATGDLEQFIETADFTNESTWKDIFNIFIDVAFGLDYMHSKGYIHWDLKIENILYYMIKKAHNHECIAMINDFDTTFKIRKGEQPGWDYPDYGSIKFRAPETNAKNQPALLTEEAGAARDMFALGCILLDILDISRKINDMTIYEKIRDAIIPLEEIEAIIEQCKTNLIGYKDFIKLAAYSLAHPDPNKRWTAPTFKEKISRFQPIEQLRRWQTSKILEKKKIEIK